MTNKLKIKQFELKEELTYGNTAVLKYTIRFPEFQSGVPKFQKAVLTMNWFYRQEALHMVKYSRKNLYRDAVAQYHYSVEHSYPVMIYEVYVDNTVTYNENCVVSLYTDQYIFTGGAHGNTTRDSNTWDLLSGRQMPLSRFIASPLYPKEYVVRQVIKQIQEGIQNGGNYYFDDYEKNAVSEFDEDQFYLRPDGLVVYYQQYAIAPYSSGIREFLFPFSSAVLQPRCRR